MLPRPTLENLETTQILRVGRRERRRDATPVPRVARRQVSLSVGSRERVYYYYLFIFLITRDAERGAATSLRPTRGSTCARVSFWRLESRSLGVSTVSPIWRPWSRLLLGKAARDTRQTRRSRHTYDRPRTQIERPVSLAPLTPPCKIQHVKGNRSHGARRHARELQRALKVRARALAARRLRLRFAFL